MNHSSQFVNFMFLFRDEIVFAPTGQHYIFQSSLQIGRQTLNCEFTNEYVFTYPQHLKQKFFFFRLKKTFFFSLCAGLWKRGFTERGAEAIIHTSSTNGLAIAELNNEHISFENFERLNVSFFYVRKFQ